MAARTSANPRGLAGLRQPTLAEIRNGLPTSFLDHLKDALEVTETQLASVVGMARQTLVRRKSQGVLRRDEGDRAAMVAKVFNRTLSYFDGHREHALDWLKHPNPALAGEAPLERADTAIGTEDVIDLIGRLEHGIPVEGVANRQVRARGQCRGHVERGGRRQIRRQVESQGSACRVL